MSLDLYVDSLIFDINADAINAKQQLKTLKKYFSRFPLLRSLLTDSISYAELAISSFKRDKAKRQGPLADDTIYENRLLAQVKELQKLITSNPNRYYSRSDMPLYAIFQDAQKHLENLHTFEIELPRPKT